MRRENGTTPPPPVTGTLVELMAVGAGERRARYSILLIDICACGHTVLHPVEIRAQSQIQAGLGVPALLSCNGGT